MIFFRYFLKTVFFTWGSFPVAFWVLFRKHSMVWPDTHLDNGGTLSPIGEFELAAVEGIFLHLLRVKG